MSKQFTATEGRVKVTAQMIEIGNDYCLIVQGGDAPHIGAVAVAQRTRRYVDPNQFATTPSVLALAGHKEFDLAKDLAMRASEALKKNVVCLCGIHVDDATKEEIEVIIRLAQQVVDQTVR